MSSSLFYSRQSKPLYAFFLALLTDVMTLENNQPYPVKTISFWSESAKGIEFDFQFIGLGKKNVGVKNIAFATAVALGVFAGTQVGMNVTYNDKKLNDNDNTKEQLTILYETMFSSVFVTIIYYYFKVKHPSRQRVRYHQVAPVPLGEMVQEGFSDFRRAINNVRRAAGVNPRDVNGGINNYLDTLARSGVAGEGVIDNWFKSFLTGINVCLGSEGIANLFATL